MRGKLNIYYIYKSEDDQTRVDTRRRQTY